MAKKKRRKFPWMPALFLLLLLSFIYEKQITRYSYKVYRVYRNLRYPADYKTGHLSYPLGYSIHGIDVSRWQDVIDWSRLKSRTAEGDTLKFRFAFIKATEGLWLEDPLYRDNWKAAGKHGVTKGAYHYFLPGPDPVKQARNFISSARLKKGDMRPVVDIEETRGKSKTSIVNQLKIYIKEIEKHYGVKPVIYSNISFIEDYLADDFKDYHFWVAHYYTDELIIDKSISWLVWQHSDKATMAGCRYYIDVNVFNGSEKDFAKLLIP